MISDSKMPNFLGWIFCCAESLADREKDHDLVRKSEEENIE